MNIWENQKNIKELLKTLVLVIGRKDMCRGALIGNEA